MGIKKQFLMRRKSAILSERLKFYCIEKSFWRYSSRIWRYLVNRHFLGKNNSSMVIEGMRPSVKFMINFRQISANFQPIFPNFQKNLSGHQSNFLLNLTEKIPSQIFTVLYPKDFAIFETICITCYTIFVDISLVVKTAE